MLEMDWHWIKVGKNYRQYCKVSGSLPPHQKISGNAQKFQGRLPPHPKKQLLGMSISFRAAYSPLIQEILEMPRNFRAACPQDDNLSPMLELLELSLSWLTTLKSNFLTCQMSFVMLLISPIGQVRFEKGWKLKLLLKLLQAFCKTHGSNGRSSLKHFQTHGNNGWSSLKQFARLMVTIEVTKIKKLARSILISSIDVNVT